MSDRLLKESDVIEAFKGRESLIHDVYTATAIIRSVPSAYRPQGEWIADKHKNIWDMDVDCYKCSVCGRYAIHRSLIMDTKGLSFCPNCGARMKGADDD